jgi:hypothetical protein
MTGQYVGLLPDYMAQDAAMEFGLVPVAGGSLFNFEHELFVMNGVETRLNPVLRYLIKALCQFVNASATA